MDNQVYHLSQKKYKRRGYKKTRIHYLLVILSILLLIVLAVYMLFDNNINYVMARYGEVIDGFTTTALIVRDEKLNYSPVGGYISLKQKEGNRISYGLPVLEIDKHILYNYQAGIISYAYDGLEEDLNPGFFRKMSVDDFNNVKRDYRQLVNGDRIKTGQPCFRIVNNNLMYVVVKLKSKELARYRINEKVFIDANEFDQGLIDGIIMDKKEAEKEGLLIIKLNIFVREWANLRQVKINFIKNIYRGIIIPRKAIFTQPAGEGVLVYKSDGSYGFKEISVIDGNNEEMVVEGLEIGESVVENPSVINFGEGLQ